MKQRRGNAVCFIVEAEMSKNVVGDSTIVVGEGIGGISRATASARNEAGSIVNAVLALQFAATMMQRAFRPSFLDEMPRGSFSPINISCFVLERVA